MHKPIIIQSVTLHTCTEHIHETGKPSLLQASWCYRGVGRILEGGFPQARVRSHAYRVGGVVVFAHAQTFASS